MLGFADTGKKKILLCASKCVKQHGELYVIHYQLLRFTVTSMSVSISNNCCNKTSIFIQPVKRTTLILFTNAYRKALVQYA